MVDRINRHAEGKTDSPNRAARTLSAKPPNSQTPPIDELIISLSNARENRRAAGKRMGAHLSIAENFDLMAAGT